MPFIPRIGRPGLLGLAARTAVVAGTATAVSGGIMAHQQKKARAQYEAERPSAAIPPSPSADPGDLVAELQRLGDLRTRGLLSEAEFETAKARLLR
jgi:Short C-terminal domain